MRQEVLKGRQHLIRRILGKQMAAGAAKRDIPRFDVKARKARKEVLLDFMRHGYPLDADLTNSARSRLKRPASSMNGA